MPPTPTRPPAKSLCMSINKLITLEKRKKRKEFRELLYGSDFVTKNGTGEASEASRLALK